MQYFKPEVNILYNHIIPTEEESTKVKAWLVRDDGRRLLSELIDASETTSGKVIPTDMMGILGDFRYMEENKIFKTYFEGGKKDKADLSWIKLLEIYHHAQKKYAETKYQITEGQLVYDHDNILG